MTVQLIFLRSSAYFFTAEMASFWQIMSEIKKCDVLCVNCHARRHWEERAPEA